MNQFPYLYPHSLSEAERLNEEELWQDNRDAEVSHTQLTEMFRHSDPAALITVMRAGPTAKPCIRLWTSLMIQAKSALSSPTYSLLKAGGYISRPVRLNSVFEMSRRTWTTIPFSMTHFSPSMKTIWTGQIMVTSPSTRIYACDRPMMMCGRVNCTISA